MVDFQNADLRTLAIIEAQFESSGFDRPTEYLIPLIGAVISEFAGEPFDIEQINERIAERFLIELPFYLTQSLTSALENRGYLRKDKVIQQHVCLDKELPDIGELSLNNEHFLSLETKLQKFASDWGLENPMASQSWQAAIMSFFRKQGVPYVESDVKKCNY